MLISLSKKNTEINNVIVASLAEERETIPRIIIQKIIIPCEENTHWKRFIEKNRRENGKENTNQRKENFLIF